jgi:hypothetical protein
MTVGVLVALTTWARAENSVLKSLPEGVQKSIEETRAACSSNDNVKVPSGDEGLVTFTLDGKQSVLIDPILICGGCYHGASCTNRGARDVEIYVRRSSWIKALSIDNIVGDIFVSTKPGYRPAGQELNALVVNLWIGNRQCPTRWAGSTSAQGWEARSCIVRWNGTRFTYKPL